MVIGASFGVGAALQAYDVLGSNPQQLGYDASTKIRPVDVV